MNNFESRFSAALGLPLSGKVLLAAVSGGADSTAMLAALAALRDEAQHRHEGETAFALHCVHVEHGIRPAVESRGDAEAVLALCRELGVPCRVFSIPQGKIAAAASHGGPGIEAAARFFRHRAWNREARRIGADFILTAHTGDDLLETLLMRILLGSGPSGLAPMQSRGRIIKPLLKFTRHDILSYLGEKGISFRTDSTNSDIGYLRNRIRHKLIPLLDEHFPSWRITLPALAETQSLAAQFIAAEAKKRLPWVREAGVLKLSEEDFFKAPPILREEAVFQGTDELLSGRAQGKAPRRLAVRRAVQQPSHNGGAAAEDLGPARLERRNRFITLMPSLRQGGERGFSLLISEPGSYTLKAGLLGIDKNLCVNIGASASFPLVFRNHRKGDCIIKGGHRRRFSGIISGPAKLAGGHSGNSAVITVCDAAGTLAFIAAPGSGSGAQVILRDGLETGLNINFWSLDV